MACASARDRPAPVGLPRRFGAILYDGLLLLALEILGGFLLLPLSGGEAVVPGAADPWLVWLHRLLLFGLPPLFFCVFWARAGETLGMRAWRVRLVACDGGRVGWRRALLRCAAALLSWACLGAGFWAALFDARRRTWHDRLSGTELVRVAGR